MDKSLDDIIASRPKTRRAPPRRQSAKAQVLGTTNSPVTRARATAPAANGVKVAPASNAPQPADKIIVSNLPPDVNEQQIRELFQTTVGPLRDVTLHYDNKGLSKGVAAVHFSRRGDGTKAFQQYNNRLIDGKRPMKIEIVVDPTRAAPAASLAARVAPPPAAAPVESAPRTGGRPRRGRGGGAAAPRRKNERQPKTAADLDAEMEDYTSAAAAPAVAA
ncbi:RRM domain-containing protein [Phanerochaete sordida]|uniref:RRM domain-containing protein n=1 Tax=Phanerochaete sordida TaxID=48140 RepID=A0A9P3FZ54_9APHY|nr:RRM domain-containing protein [Phanerochaete sordida]